MGSWKENTPLGLAYVAAALEKAGFQVEIFDNYLLNKPIDYVKLKIKKISPEIVGITCGSVTYRQCLETAKAVKEVLPFCKVVVGGWHPSYKCRRVFSVAWRILWSTSRRKISIMNRC